MAWETLVPLGTFLAVALAVWGGLSATADRRSRVSDTGPGRRLLRSALRRSSSVVTRSTSSSALRR